MRKLINYLLAAAALGSMSVVILILGGLIIVIAQKGLPAISWSFLSSGMKQAGASGGIIWHLVGTLLLITTAWLITSPLSLSLALLQQVWLDKKGRWSQALRLFFYTCNGVPSIVFGLFGFMIFVQYFNWGKSWLVGGIVLAMSMLPTVTLAIMERMEAIPAKYLEASAALGLSKTQVVWSVILPQSLTGLATGSLLALARAAGETAPIMFTATIFAGATFPDGIRENPVLTLPYHIFILAQDSFDPAMGPQLWGSALVLIALVATLSLLALPLRLIMHEESHD